MTPKGPPHLPLFLMLLVPGACLSQLSEGSTDYEEFLKRHVDFPKTQSGNDSIYCKEMMHNRGMLCWRKNTFLHTKEDPLQAVCSSRGHIIAERVRSPVPFSLTACSRRGKKPHVSCNYKGESMVRKIWVTCKKGTPIQFSGFE